MPERLLRCEVRARATAPLAVVGFVFVGAIVGVWKFEERWSCESLEGVDYLMSSYKYLTFDGTYVVVVSYCYR